MANRFFELFTNFTIDADFRGILEETIVEKVSVNRNRDAMRIYLTFNTLVPKRRIDKLEKEIKRQLFRRDHMTVYIMESFRLSSLYNSENLFEEYKDSIFEELDEYSPLLLNALKKAEITFVGDSMRICLEDTIVSRNSEEELFRVLDKIFNDRCHIPTKIEISYMQAKESRYKKQSQLTIENELRSISRRFNKADDKADENIGSIGAEDGSKPKTVSAQKPAYKGERKGRDRSFDKTAGSDDKRPETLVRSSNPDVLYGRDFEGDCIPISEIIDEIGDVVFHGKVLEVEFRPIRNERVIASVVVTDFTDSIVIKLFLAESLQKEFEGNIYPGAFIKVAGRAAFDTFDKEITISSVRGIMKTPDFTVGRCDNAFEKRVELHCHTKMSDMDGVSDVKDIIAQAKRFGHKAIAITDHGVVQSFPDADHCNKDRNFKVIYGCEGYLVDDTKKIITNPTDDRIEDCTYVVFDFETTGFSSDRDKIIEIGAVKVKNGEIIDSFSEFINPERPIPYEIVKLTTITDEMVIGAETVDHILPRFMEFSKDCVMVAHNAEFDMGFLKRNCERLDIPCNETYIDTVSLGRFLYPKWNKFTLDYIANQLNIVLESHHRAVDDATCTGHIFLRFLKEIEAYNIHTLRELDEKAMLSPEAVSRLHSNHVIILAKNDIGRINLYRLVSFSHLYYFHSGKNGGQPKMPKSLINKYREGLIIGSACEAGELFQAIVDQRSSEQIARIVDFYDYLEIQPVGNNAFMLRGDKPKAQSIEDLRDYNREIVRLGTLYNKPVVATCDVHFLNPEDEVYRRIIQKGKGYKDADEQPPLYLHTTDEMLEEFSYLGSDKAVEVVITNTNKIADMCEWIHPTRPDKCPPVIEDSDITLRKICYDKAHEMYGENLPEIVTKRLERELNSIISNGYAVMYIIAQKLVWKSNEDGYLVGSRGSVGSSFVATMAGITEVNPLSPHYLCRNCHYVDFDSPEVKAFAGRSGCDMPDKICPNCGEKLYKDGFDIPFETFLGFKGNKEPDIDLNFSGDYQGKAHRYTEVIFGEGQTFRAGTIGTLADKTAYGYIKKYYEEKGIAKRNCEINRIVQGCVGVRRTTGQHPGGIIVLPVGEEIYSFTPVQHPANDMDKAITTHFDYHSIDMNLLKLDILGHDDPTMIRMLEDLTGLHAQDFPLDDPQVMSLFKNTSALKVSSEDLWANCPLGTLGIPEFGTDFAMQMLIDAKPQEFSDLIRIAGLAHGTDVWLGNAQTLIAEGKATISTAICTRDDIMTYLISMGLESERSFKIMEAVRKGTVAKGKCDKWEEWKADMKAHNVPDWYIWSCEKIKYMFPKAHAAAYVMMAWRVAYCKVYYPLAYYAAFFSIRATAFSYELMCQGKDKVEYYLKEFTSKENPTAKDGDYIRDMRLVQEMYARGFEFLPMDLYKSDARYFQIVDGKLLPPFNTLEGMGDGAAESLKIAADEAPFLSQKDLHDRGKVSQSVIDLMAKMHIIDGLPEDDQISLFDMIV